MLSAIVLTAAESAGYQAAQLDSTVVLSEQHLSKLEALLSVFPVKCGCLTGSTTAKKRREMCAECRDGTCNLIMCTHACIQKGVYFKALCLVFM